MLSPHFLRNVFDNILQPCYQSSSILQLFSKLLFFSMWPHRCYHLSGHCFKADLCHFCRRKNWRHFLAPVFVDFLNNLFKFLWESISTTWKKMKTVNRRSATLSAQQLSAHPSQALSSSFAKCRRSVLLVTFHRISRFQKVDTFWRALAQRKRSRTLLDLKNQFSARIFFFFSLFSF